MTSTTEGQVTVTIEERIEGDDVEMFYALYEQAFGPLRTLAAARHVLRFDEFAGEMSDSRVQKFVSRTETGVPTSLTTLTNRLDAVAWISPEFFANRYPEQAVREAIYYLGYTLVTPLARNSSTFTDVVSKIVSTLSDLGAVLCCDICGHHTDRGFADALVRISDSVVPTTAEVLNVQTFYGVSFDGARPSGRQPQNNPR